MVEMLTSANADLDIVNKVSTHHHSIIYIVMFSTTVLQANRTPLLEAVWHRHRSVIHYFVEEVKVDTTNMTKVIT